MGSSRLSPAPDRAGRRSLGPETVSPPSVARDFPKVWRDRAKKEQGEKGSERPRDWLGALTVDIASDPNQRSVGLGTLARARSGDGNSDVQAVVIGRRRNPG